MFVKLVAWIGFVLSQSTFTADDARTPDQRIRLTRRSADQNPILPVSQSCFNPLINLGIWRLFSAEFCVPRFLPGIFRLLRMSQIKLLPADFPREIIVIILRRFADREFSEECTQFQGAVRLLIHFDGEFDFEISLASIIQQRGKTLAQTAGAGEQIYDWNRHRARILREMTVCVRIYCDSGWCPFEFFKFFR